MSENKISLKFIGFNKDGDHVEYKIIVKDSNNDTWQLTERYSGLRNIYRDLREVLSPEELPDFPPKKLFGSMSESFITQRQKALENFFNNLLKKFRYDQLTPLKTLLESKRPKKDVASSKDQEKEEAAAKLKKNEKEKLMNLEKVISNFKNEFLDLNDTLNPPEEEEIKKKKSKYNFKLDIGPDNVVYNLPSGTESNLISIQDKSLPNIDTNISSIMSCALESIKQGVSNINFHNDQPIVISLD